MDKPTTPAGGGGTRSPWTDGAGTDDSASETAVGATGLFGTLSLPDEPAGWTPVAAAALPPAAPFMPVAPVAAPVAVAPVASVPVASVPVASVPAAKPLAEPVVHKVVLGGSTDESPAQLLDRIRAVTAERAVSVKPAAAPSAQGSGGFTELLRTLGTETPVPGAKPAGAGSAGAAVPNSGFTSLLQTLNAPSKPAAVAPVPVAAPPAAWQPVASQAPPADAPAFAAPVAPAHAPGGFTELLRMSGPSSSAGSGQNAAFGDLAMGGSGSQAKGSQAKTDAAPAPAANQPGEFTRLFGTFSASEPGGAEASGQMAAPPAVRAPEPYTGSGPGSFTRMLSLEQQSLPDVPVYREETPAARAGMDYGLTPGAPQPGQPGTSANLDPFFQPAAEAAPVVESTPAAGVGITRLIQMLDAPVRQEMPPAPIAPAAPPSQGGPGVWTQTFASLSSSTPPAASAAPAESWQLPVAPAAAMPPAAPASAGPSEFTRILDASRMREQAMKGGAPAPAAPAGAAQPFAPMQMPHPQMPQVQMPQVQMPQVQMPPAMPQSPAMGGMKPMAQPGGFAPPQMPGGFAAPQMPAMAVPQPPPIPAPQPPAAGKLQQMVPILLVVAIVLLVVVLVTVIFLLKK